MRGRLAWEGFCKALSRHVDLRAVEEPLQLCGLPAKARPQSASILYRQSQVGAEAAAQICP